MFHLNNGQSQLYFSVTSNVADAHAIYVQKVLKNALKMHLEAMALIHRDTQTFETQRSIQNCIKCYLYDNYQIVVFLLVLRNRQNSCF